MAETLRIATYNAELTRAGPGLLLQDIQRGEDPQIAAVVAVLAELDADIVLLTGIDYDYGAVALTALAERLAEIGAPYPYLLALRPNTGVATGLDLDGNGYLGDARDAQGFGMFAGEAGMAVLSRRPILADQARDFSGLLWKDLPGAHLPDTMTAEIRRVQRLSTSGHWEVPIEIAPGRSLRLLAWYATPPVFDGPEDRNGLRNQDETALWLRLLDGKLAQPAPETPFVILGQSSLDPVDGEGRSAALRSLLAHPALQDPEPRGTVDRQDAGQDGDPALDTALYDQIGGLRVEVVLPSADLSATGTGVLWPPDADPFAATLAAASRHRPVWVDIALP